jgi:hypothetical protein
VPRRRPCTPASGAGTPLGPGPVACWGLNPPTEGHPEVSSSSRPCTSSSFPSLSVPEDSPLSAGAAMRHCSGGSASSSLPRSMPERQQSAPLLGESPGALRGHPEASRQLPGTDLHRRLLTAPANQQGICSKADFGHQQLRARPATQGFSGSSVLTHSASGPLPALVSLPMGGRRQCPGSSCGTASRWSSSGWDPYRTYSDTSSWPGSRLATPSTAQSSHCGRMSQSFSAASTASSGNGWTQGWGLADGAMYEDSVGHPVKTLGFGRATPESNWDASGGAATGAPLPLLTSMPLGRTHFAG